MFFLPRKDRWLDDYAVPAIVYFLGDHAPIETRVFPSLGTHGKGKLEVPLLIDKTRPGGEMQRSWPVNGACKKGRVENGSRYRREGLRPRSACDTREETRENLVQRPCHRHLLRSREEREDRVRGFTLDWKRIRSNGNQTIDRTSFPLNGEKSPSPCLIRRESGIKMKRRNGSKLFRVCVSAPDRK